MNALQPVFIKGTSLKITSLYPITLQIENTVLLSWDIIFENFYWNIPYFLIRFNTFVCIPSVYPTTMFPKQHECVYIYIYLCEFANVRHLYAVRVNPRGCCIAKHTVVNFNQWQNLSSMQWSSPISRVNYWRLGRGSRKAH